MKTKRAFTLIELLVTLAIIAIISAVVVPNFTGSQRKAQDDNAVARGAVLDLAKTTFLQERGADGEQEWTDADALAGYPSTPPSALSAKDEAKYNLLRPYLSAPPGGSGPDYGLGYGIEKGKYTPIGYWFNLNGLSDPTTIYRHIGGGAVGSDGSGERVILELIASPTNGGSVSGGGSYTAGSTRTIKAQEFQNFTFAGWSGGVTSTDRIVDVTLPSSGKMTATATFTYTGPSQVTLTVLGSTGGTTSISPGSYTRSRGSTESVTATAADGYTFSGWSTGETSGTLSLTLNDSITVRPIFTPKNYSVTVNTSDANMGTVSGGGSYANNGTATVVATPKANYKFVSWTGDHTSTDQNHSFTVTGDTTLTANFASDPAQQYTFAITAGTGGTVTSNPVAGTYGVGTSFTITATPSTDYTFLGWSGGTGGVFANQYEASTTFTLGASNATVQANFIKAGSGGTTEPSVTDLYGFPEGSGMPIAKIRGISADNKYIFLQAGRADSAAAAGRGDLYIYRIADGLLRASIKMNAQYDMYATEIRFSKDGKTFYWPRTGATGGFYNEVDVFQMNDIETGQYSLNKTLRLYNPANNLNGAAIANSLQIKKATSMVNDVGDRMYLMSPATAFWVEGTTKAAGPLYSFEYNSSLPNNTERWNSNNIVWTGVCGTTFGQLYVPSSYKYTDSGIEGTTTGYPYFLQQQATMIQDYFFVPQMHSPAAWTWLRGSYDEYAAYSRATINGIGYIKNNASWNPSNYSRPANLTFLDGSPYEVHLSDDGSKLYVLYWSAAATAWSYIPNMDGTAQAEGLKLLAFAFPSMELVRDYTLDIKAINQDNSEYSIESMCTDHAGSNLYVLSRGHLYSYSTLNQATSPVFPVYVNSVNPTYGYSARSILSSYVDKNTSFSMVIGLANPGYGGFISPETTVKVYDPCDHTTVGSHVFTSPSETWTFQATFKKPTILFIDGTVQKGAPTYGGRYFYNYIP